MTSAPQLRQRFEPDDEELSRLHALAFGGGHRGTLPWGDRLRAHSVTWVGAFVSQELVAFVHVVWDGGLHGFLLDTIVHPDHQRQGLGRAVVELAARGAKDAGCAWLHVDYEPHLEPFYKACGFGKTAAGLRNLEQEGGAG